jgi:ankyrin repeat protein
MRAAKKGKFTSLPPRGNTWIDILKLLVQYGASIHEIVHNKSVSMLNIVSEKEEPQTVQFFRLLKEECYVDFSMSDNRGWSALVLAIRSKSYALDSIKFLEGIGVNLSLIYADGRTMLHFAAEMSPDAQVLDYLCSVCDISHLNRQDILGWTALHYALISEWLGSISTPMAKVVNLLKRGADPTLKATHHIFFTRKRIQEPEFTAFDLCKGLSSTLCSQFIEAAKSAGLLIPQEVEEDIFYDA